MSRKRFRWTRKSYAHAAWLTRFAGRHLYDVYQTPDAVRRYFELWDRHPQKDDPLLRHVKHRLDAKRRAEQDDGIPF
jgi:hypothetical protein